MSFLSVVFAQNDIRLFEPIKNSTFCTPVKKDFAYGLISYSYATRPTEYRAEIFIANDSDKPIDFKEAKYTATAEDNSIHTLEYREVDFNDGIRHSTTLNPTDTIRILCNSPFNPEYKKIAKIEIELKDGRKLIFIPEEVLLRN